MRPDEPNTFDTHEPIDLSNEAKVSEMTEKLDCSQEELTAAVEKVGPQPVAVAIFLGKPDALDLRP
jgi:Protein of unknown function (DUF3606)